MTTSAQEKPTFCCLCPQRIHMNGMRPVVREGVPAELVVQVTLDGPTGSSLPVWAGGLCHTHRKDYSVKVERKEESDGK